MPMAMAGMTGSLSSIPHSQNTPANNLQNVLRSFQSLFSPEAAPFSVRSTPVAQNDK